MNYKSQSVEDYLKLLAEYMLIAPYMVPKGHDTLNKQVLRHPDLQPSNVFVSDDFDVISLIDWQHTCILPLFLHSELPKAIQNYADEVSAMSHPFWLPNDFDTLSASEQENQLEIFRRRHVHYLYMCETREQNPMHFEGLCYRWTPLSRRLFVHVSAPWEGDIVPLKTDLIHVTENWPAIVRDSPMGSLSCPIQFGEAESQECLRLHSEYEMTDSTMILICERGVGMGEDGWVPEENYDHAVEQLQRLKEESLASAQSDSERELLLEHWPFEDHDEEMYH